MFRSADRQAVANRLGKSGEVFEDLKRLIVLGELAPGAPLVELELAQHFGCSQGPVREALLALQVEGLVIRQGHRGTRVSDCTEAEAVEMFLLRRGIETRGVRRASVRATSRLLDDLRSLVEAMEACAGQNDEYGLSEHDRAFHQRLFQGADLPAVEPILMRCILHNHRFKITRSDEARDLMQTARRHWSIVEELESGDAEAAARAIGHHVETIVDFGPAVFSPAEGGADVR